MKVCGFSFVRNAVKFDYPVAEAIGSALPLCDAFVVAVGESEDGTLELIRSIDPRIQVVKTVWDETQRQGGRVLAQETDKAFQAIPPEYDWAFYLQADEVIHERDEPAIRRAMEESLGDARVEGLLFKYRHFWGSYDYVGTKWNWYRREIRIIRNRKDIFSYRDAQGFRRRPNHKLRVKLVDAWIHHYGWVRDPRALQGKERAKARYYKDDRWIEDHLGSDRWEYEAGRQPVTRFEGAHPRIMQDRIRRKNWAYQPDPSLKYHSAKDFAKRLVGDLTGWYPGEYRNYKLVR